MATPNQSPFAALPGGSQSGGGAFVEGLKKGVGVGKGGTSKRDWENAAKLSVFQHQLSEVSANNAHIRGQQMAVLKHGHNKEIEGVRNRGRVAVERQKGKNTLAAHAAATDTLHSITDKFGGRPTSHRTDAGTTTFAYPESEAAAPISTTNTGTGGAHVDPRSEAQFTPSPAPEAAPAENIFNNLPKVSQAAVKASPLNAEVKASTPKRTRSKNSGPSLKPTFIEPA